MNMFIWSWMNLYLLQGWCCSSRHVGFCIREEWYASWLACAWRQNWWNLDKSLQVDISFRNPFFLLPIDMFWRVFLNLNVSLWWFGTAFNLTRLCEVIYYHFYFILIHHYWNTINYRFNHTKFCWWQCFNLPTEFSYMLTKEGNKWD